MWKIRASNFLENTEVILDPNEMKKKSINFLITMLLNLLKRKQVLLASLHYAET